jgi:hypothetical protein
VRFSAGVEQTNPKRPDVRAGHVMLLCGVALVAPGCGRDGDRAEVRSVADRFLRALEEHDGAAACAALSPDTRKQLEDDEQQPCREAVGSLGLQQAPVARVQVFITNAKADLANGDSLFLSQGREGWRLSAVGCRPAEGKPADRPYDCALEA